MRADPNHRGHEDIFFADRHSFPGERLFSSKTEGREVMAPERTD